MKSILAITAFALCGAAALASEPAGYYNKCENKCGRELLSSLCAAVGNPQVVGYKGLWELYKLSDVDADGKIWDMYSTKRWVPGKEQCGTYTSVGDCYNREHSLPKSWFNDALPMYADAFHIYPTDGKVNGQRGNYPFGECRNGTTLSATGGVRALGRLGECTYPGYNGTVFEPDEQYKGDFARSYFYMAACYNDRISSWTSDMLDGSSYPAFEKWAIEMLLKWNAADPVSTKETERNEVVYAHQGNRNPFIDHPELAEHIWGSKSTVGWSYETRSEAQINRPADGTALDLGRTGKNIVAELEIDVVATNAEVPVKLSATYPFYVVPGEISAADANAGAKATVCLAYALTGTCEGTLTVTCATAKSTVELKGEVVEGIPANAATDITDHSFTANWVYAGDDNDGKYTLIVRDAEGVVASPAVDAKAGKYTVGNLQPSTDYTYTLTGKTQSSNSIAVRTSGTLPFVDFLFDGELFFRTQPGIASAPAEILMYSENIGESPISVSVDEPFELSTDKSSWSCMLSLTPDENRFYLRLGAAEAGEYVCAIVAESGSYRNDACTVRGEVTGKAFFEDFEAEPDNDNGYADIYVGSACTWLIKEGGFWTADPVYDGARSLRFSKKAEGFVAMNEDRPQGIGTVSFYAAKWNNDKEADATVLVETSTDGGATWQEAGRTVISDKTFRQYSFVANVEGSARMRLRQTAGARWLVDNISISDAQTGVAEPDAGRHCWDAYSCNGKLIVEARRDTQLAIYCIDGTTLFAGTIAAGLHSFDAQPGQFYIVASADFSRTVLVR